MRLRNALNPSACLLWDSACSVSRPASSRTPARTPSPRTRPASLACPHQSNPRPSPASRLEDLPKPSSCGNHPQPVGLPRKLQKPRRIAHNFRGFHRVFQCLDHPRFQRRPLHLCSACSFRYTPAFWPHALDVRPRCIIHPQALAPDFHPAFMLHVIPLEPRRRNPEHHVKVGMTAPSTFP